METDKIVYTDREQVREFVRFANRYKTDFLSGTMRQFLDMPFPQIFEFVKRQYTLEQGEQIIRPKYYYELSQKGYPSGDCDDGTIFIVALFLCAGYPAEKIIICEAKELATDRDYCHIFAAVETQSGQKIYFDNLPQSKFNQLDYAENCVRFSRASEYI